MKEASWAPMYASIYPHITEIARSHGYALCIHGSVGKERYSDLDLLAVPWTDDAHEPEVLMSAIWDWAVRLIINDGLVDLFKKEFYPVEKPHGRLAWFLQIGNGAGIDISVMPKRNIT